MLHSKFYIYRLYMTYTKIKHEICKQSLDKYHKKPLYLFICLATEWKLIHLQARASVFSKGGNV